MSVPEIPETVSKSLTECWDNVTACVSDGDVEDVLTALSIYLRADSERESHATVKALLMSASEHCSTAAFEYYASTK